MPQSGCDPRSQEHQRRHKAFLVADLENISSFKLERTVSSVGITTVLSFQ